MDYDKNGKYRKFELFSVDDLAMTLDEHLSNQTLDILKIVAILKVINREAVNGK